MIHLGTPNDLQPQQNQQFILVVAYAINGDLTMVAFSHGRVWAMDEFEAYNSQVMADLENRLLSQGYTLLNNLVIPVKPEASI